MNLHILRKNDSAKRWLKEERASNHEAGKRENNGGSGIDGKDRRIDIPEIRHCTGENQSTAGPDSGSRKKPISRATQETAENQFSRKNGGNQFWWRTATAGGASVLCKPGKLVSTKPNHSNFKDTESGRGLSLAIKRAKPNTGQSSSSREPKTQEEVALKKAEKKSRTKNKTRRKNQKRPLNKLPGQLPRTAKHKKVQCQEANKKWSWRK